jgi:hypothetical protein
MFLFRRCNFAMRYLRVNTAGFGRIFGTYSRSACCCISPGIVLWVMLRSRAL